MRGTIEALRKKNRDRSLAMANLVSKSFEWLTNKRPFFIIKMT